MLVIKKFVDKISVDKNLLLTVGILLNVGKVER